jgi:SAM-dependent methyltransferase
MMLDMARSKDPKSLVKWDWQNAATLTYPDGIFDVVFISQLLHHLDEPLAALMQCRRVLGQGGAVLVRYASFEQIRRDAKVAFFPEALAIDEIRCPSVSTVEGWLEMAGFKDVCSTAVVQPSHKDGMSLLAAVATKSVSVLTLISDEAFERGFSRLEKYVKDHPGDPWLTLTELTLTLAKVGD